MHFSGSTVGIHDPPGPFPSRLKNKNGVCGAFEERPIALFTFEQRLFSLLALGDILPEFFIDLLQGCGAFVHQVLQTLAVPFQLLPGPLALRDVLPDCLKNLTP